MKTYPLHVRLENTKQGICHLIEKDFENLFFLIIACSLEIYFLILNTLLFKTASSGVRKIGLQ